VSHLLVGDDSDNDEEVADKTGETNRAEHHGQQNNRLQQRAALKCIRQATQTARVLNGQCIIHCVR